MMDTTPRPETTPVTARLAEAFEVEPEVARFLADVRAGYRTELPSDVVSGHLRMILAEAAVSPAPPSLRDRWARRARRIAAVGAVKIALTATAAAAAAGTGLAATGSLPDAVQTAVANVAEHVGVTLPVPAAETPGDREVDGQDRPGIGEGGVPQLVEDEGELPGNTDEAPGLHRDEDGRPAPATDRGASGDDHRSPRGHAGADQADDRPAPAERPAPKGDAVPREGDAAEGDVPEDTPAADRSAADGPAAPAAPPATTQDAGTAGDAGDAGDTPGAAPRHGAGQAPARD